jgi:hypothetical protein
MTERATSKTNPWREGLLITLCILFFIGSVFIWLPLTSTVSRVIYYVVLFIPAILCGDYLGRKLFSHSRRLSVSAVGFSPLRIFVGVCFVLGLFVLIYGIWFILGTIFR